MTQKRLPFAAVKPKGWIHSHMTVDIKEGFVGQLDKLVPDLIIDDDIYDADRLSTANKSKDVGTATTGAEWEVQFLWWNSETQSNWWDGLIRNALLSQDETTALKVDKYVQSKLRSQDNEGYLGIYGADLRFKQNSENGELWAQSSLLRGLLAYYEATDKSEVLDAIKSAVDLIMQCYPVDASNPFAVNKPMAGVAHGLTITDVFHTLHQITGEQRYADYAVFLFKSYDISEQAEKDIQTTSLNDVDYKFSGHGVHTYEHLRALAIAAYYSKNEKYDNALASYLKRLDTVTTISGAPIGDEWISERNADPDNTGYEYCSIVELLHSYSVLLELTNNPEWADKIEWLFYNAALGGRAPDNKSIAYCNTDNCYQLMGHLDVNNPQNEERFKYSPTHQDVAVCCAPNAGKVFPYFVQNIAGYLPTGIIINLYGPSTIEARVDDIKVKITQETDYPSEFEVSFFIECEKPAHFTLSIRRPNWAASVHANCSFIENERYIEIERDWTNSQRINIEFKAEPTVEKLNNERVFVRYGPLLFVEPIPFKPLVIRHHDLSGFMDCYFKPQIENRPNLGVSETQKFEIVRRKDDSRKHIGDISLVGNLVDLNSGVLKEIELKPIAYSVLRKSCFLISSN